MTPGGAAAVGSDWAGGPRSSGSEGEVLVGGGGLGLRGHLVSPEGSGNRVLAGFSDTVLAGQEAWVD